ncbi:hypothetical protein BD289DRAFT_507183 [Coniella lustricola]|uniref:Uncharacterized protein n=1 Tax=Coniella lustricola TaxID=2025994 RepID=A0A2T3A3L9_9PEZI|nr:hypothetical protein BD289DRAFT_507183 [Coniella lustricola]
MQFTTALYAVLAALPIVSANGCYGSGDTFAEYGTSDELATAREEACAALVSTIPKHTELMLNLGEPRFNQQSRKLQAGEYPAGQTKNYCASNGQASINFSATSNSGSTTLTLTADDCVSAMIIEMEACSHGSVQSHGSFTYKDDPNAGSC